MPFRLRVNHGSNFAVAEVSGLAFMEEAAEVVGEIARATRDHGDRKLLINLTDVVGTLEPEQHQMLGLMAARHLGHLRRIASFVPEDKITRVSEQAAGGQGLNLRVFTSLTQAVAWLMQED